jgi:hypothetical protein
MATQSNLWRAVRWPAVLVAVACLGIVAAAILDRTEARELALTIGAPSLTILLPLGLLWLAVAVAIYVLQRRRGTPA